MGLPSWPHIWLPAAADLRNNPTYPRRSRLERRLDAALKMWSSGEPHGPVKSFSIPINVFDAQWQAGKQLENYEILREEKSDGPKIFVVKMKLKGDDEKETKYLVVGKKPLLVFSEKAYGRASGTGG